MHKGWPNYINSQMWVFVCFLLHGPVMEIVAARASNFMITAYFGRVKVIVLLGQRPRVARRRRAAALAKPVLRPVFRDMWRGWNTHPSSWTLSWVSGFRLDWNQDKIRLPHPKICLHRQRLPRQVPGSHSSVWNQGLKVCLRHGPIMVPGMATLGL